MKGDGIRWAVAGLAALVAGGGIYYQYQNTRPCVHPIPYALGTIDSRFGIKNSALITDAKVAAGIWNTAAGKTVLVYDPEAEMKINFVYDEREANARLGIEISRAQADADTARAELDSERRAFLAAQDAYNQEVKTINARGGATPKEAETLAQERAVLKVLADAINTAAARFNANIATLNAKVKEYNQTAGHPFEEGQYVRDSKGERIIIFEFVGATQLTRVLAHEFGHAIGLDHNDDPNSIMYAKNESGNLAPTVSDLSALRALCGI